MTVGLFTKIVITLKTTGSFKPSISKRFQALVHTFGIFSKIKVISESSCTKFCSDAPDARIPELFSNSTSLVLLLDFASEDAA